MLATTFSVPRHRRDCACHLSRAGLVGVCAGPRSESPTRPQGRVPPRLRVGLSFCRLSLTCRPANGLDRQFIIRNGADQSACSRRGPTDKSSHGSSRVDHVYCNPWCVHPWGLLDLHSYQHECAHAEHVNKNGHAESWLVGMYRGRYGVFVASVCGSRKNQNPAGRIVRVQQIGTSYQTPCYIAFSLWIASSACILPPMALKVHSWGTMPLGVIQIECSIGERVKMQDSGDTGREVRRDRNC